MNTHTSYRLNTSDHKIDTMNVREWKVIELSHFTSDVGTLLSLSIYPEAAGTARRLGMALLAAADELDERIVNEDRLDTEDDHE
jgi:hypothetical protein